LVTKVSNIFQSSVVPPLTCDITNLLLNLAVSERILKFVLPTAKLRARVSAWYFSTYNGHAPVFLRQTVQYVSEMSTDSLHVRWTNL